MSVIEKEMERNAKVAAELAAANEKKDEACEAEEARLHNNS